MDTQSRKYQLTINNPLPDYNHENIKKIMSGKFKSFCYLAMMDEIGNEEHTPHTHVLVCFNSAVRFSTLKKHFPTAHIEVLKGTVAQNLDYIQKKGKWADSDKSETTVNGTFEELGIRPADNKGKRQDMQELYEMVEAGMTNSEIIQTNKDYILQMDKIDRLRTTILQDKFRNTRRTDLEVCYVFGKTGTGKSRTILDTYGDENVYRVTDYIHPFDSYACEPVIVFEEFRSSLPLQEMLNYLDIYPITLKARYSNKYACFTKVFICTNWELEKQYNELQKGDLESWNAFLRRIHKVKHYTGKGIIDYNSVDDYFERNNDFVPVEELPKEEQLAIADMFTPTDNN